MRAIALLFAVLATVVIGSPFDAHISTSSSSLANESFVVDFALTNTGEKSLTLCRWGTPLDKNSPVFRADMFDIVSELGVSPVYSGILMKRRLSFEDVVTLQPGETVSASVDLQNGYWFAEQGKYKLRLQSYLYIFNGEEFTATSLVNGINDFTSYELTTTEILPIEVIDLVEAPQRMNQVDDGKLGTVTPAANCPTNNQTTIRTTDNNALTLVNRVNSYINGACPSGKYVTWMGACDTSRYSTVRNNFAAIQSRINNGYRVDCAGSSCSANVFAYVYATDTTYTVYVCGAFWSASVNTCSFDSKPGTIVHEISHFRAVAGTGDVAYGQSACQNLARTNPGQAITNADNHEYLAESCPP